MKKIPKKSNQHRAVKPIFSYAEKCIKQGFETPEKINKMIKIVNELNNALTDKAISTSAV